MNGKARVTVDRLLEERQIPLTLLVERSGLEKTRVEAIVAGRWLASPSERAAIALGLGATVDDIDWGHTMSPRNVRYHQFGLHERF
ncbi:MAG: hypothetical protein KDA60_15560 [Planctomycetales bacterium]|nr:hypothetical protein [Planctomycetales bacterium]